MKTGDLFSVLIHLQALENSSSRPQTNLGAGHLAHAAFLDLLRQTDPSLSQQLHDANQRKPFTLSSLTAGEQAVIYSLRQGQSYQLRLTSLGGLVFEAFIQRFLGLEAAKLTIRLGNTGFRVIRIQGRANPNCESASESWIGRSSFEALSLADPTDRHWHFEFASPTAFSLGEQEWGGRKFVVLPEPGQVFDSLAGSWNDFAPPDLSRIDKLELRRYVEKYLVITQQATQTRLLQFKQHAQVGFVGTASYRLMEKQPSPAMLDTLNRLAGLALYAGVGYKTTMGMGQTRCTSQNRAARPTDQSPKAAPAQPRGAEKVS